MTEIATKKETSTIVQALQRGNNCGMVVGAFTDKVSIYEATPLAKDQPEPEGAVIDQSGDPTKQVF